MRRLSIFIFALSLTALLVVYVRYSGEMNVKSTRNEWAEITNIEKKERNLPKLGMSGTYLFYMVTVKLKDGSTSIVRIENKSNIQLHGCLPVKVSLFYSGDKMILVDNQKLLFSEIKRPPCSQ